MKEKQQRRAVIFGFYFGIEPLQSSYHRSRFRFPNYAFTFVCIFTVIFCYILVVELF